jgi:hypothetical protein
MFVEESKAFDDPQIEAAARVLRYFLYDMTSVLEPLEF